MDRDVVRIGRVVVILPIDLDRDEVVLIRQFRLGAHLALGQGDLVEVPAGRVERGENVPTPPGANARRRSASRRERWCRLFDLMPSAGCRTSTCSFSSAWSRHRKVPERAGAAHEQEDTRPLRVPIDRALDALGPGTALRRGGDRSAMACSQPRAIAATIASR